MRLVSDLRYALRQLRKSPAFAIAVILTLAAAIAANSAIFSVVHAVLLKPLPYAAPDRLLCVWWADIQGAPWYTFSHPAFQFYRAQLSDVADLAAYDDEIVTVLDHGEPIRVEGGRVSANFFAVLGIHPALGRGFAPDEDAHAANAVAVLSHRFWRQRYNADSGIVGRSITVDGEPFTIIGVMPPEMQFQGSEVDIWRTRIVDTRTYAPASVQLGATYLTVIGRLRPGVTLPQFRAKLSAVNALDERPNPKDLVATTALLQPMLVANVRSTILVLWGAVACLLAIACANVANLVLARASSRLHEIGVRFALGASRWHVARQLIAESMVLCACAVVLALPFADSGMHWLTAALQQTSRAVPAARLDPRVLLFTFGTTAALALVLGLAPMWMIRAAAMHAGSRGTSASRWSTRFRGAMVAAQLASCLVLLAGGGLLMQSFSRMTTMHTGIRTDHVTVFPLDLMPDRYSTFEKRAAFYNDVVRRVETIPGVLSAGITSRIDLVNRGLGYMIRMDDNPDPALRFAGTRGRSVSPDYFRVLGIPLLRGRVFDDRDTSQSARVAVINEAFAHKFFAGVDPIGKYVTYSTDKIKCQIVGLVANVRAGLQETGVEDNLYLPLSQRPWLVAQMLVRAENPRAIASAIRENVRAADPQQAVAQSTPLDQVIADRLSRPRTTMWVVVAFGASALFLAGVGIYGVISFSVALRRKEIGIRVALGADGGRVRMLLFAQTARLFAIAVSLGLPLAMIVSRLYRGLLFAVEPGDPMTFAGTVAVLVGVAALATYVPAARAAKTDPLEVPRAE